MNHQRHTVDTNNCIYFITSKGLIKYFKDASHAYSWLKETEPNEENYCDYVFTKRVCNNNIINQEEFTF